VIHVALFMAPMALWGWVLDVGAFGVAANVVLIILWNDIMHTNARLSPSLQRLLEWVVTTPRYHHIHHSEDPQHRGVNLASILTIWDRLARTYVDPDRVDNLHLVFGSEDAARRPIWRSLIGV
jgi:sterol desaturase/sphingolipid hydroxylase (fatty acid hydroxylase superfamily)